MPDRHFVALKAAVWKDGKLLMQREVKNDKFRIDLPGGRIDSGEEMHTGLRREVMEELGVELSSISDLPVKVWSGTGTSPGRNFVVLLYECELASEDFNLNHNTDDVEEIQSAGYLTLKEIEGGPEHVHTKHVIEYFKQKQGL